MIRIAAAALLAAIVVIPATAGEYNKKVNVGQKAPSFSSLPGVDGKEHSLADFKKDLVVVTIISNHCPMVGIYEDRICSLAKKFGDKVDFVAINVSNMEADKLDKMKERATEKGYNFAYLYDESQKIARSLGATVTPEFFVLNKDRKIVYMGALDDNQDASKVEKTYLNDAITSALKGETPATTETRARGCGVAYDREKK